MGELQLDSCVFVPFQLEGGGPQEIAQGTEGASLEITDVTERVDGAGGADDTNQSHMYTGPELVLPQPDQDTPLAEQPLFPKTTDILASNDSAATRWHERLSHYTRSAVVIATLGGVLTAACSGHVDGQGNAQPGGAPHTSAVVPAPSTSPTTSSATSIQREPQPSVSSVTYPCTFTGRTELPSNDARVRSGTSIDERVVAQLLDTSTADIAQCDAPRIVDGIPRDPTIVTGVEYLQKSTGTRIVAMVYTDKVNADTGRPASIDNFLASPNDAIDMGYNNYNGAFTCAPAVDDLTRTAECDGILTMPKDTAGQQFYVFSLDAMEDAQNKHGLGHFGPTIRETAGDKVSKTNSLLGENMPLTIGPPTPGR